MTPEVTTALQAGVFVVSLVLGWKYIGPWLGRAFARLSEPEPCRYQVEWCGKDGVICQGCAEDRA